MATIGLKSTRMLALVIGYCFLIHGLDCFGLMGLKFLTGKGKELLGNPLFQSVNSKTTQSSHSLMPPIDMNDNSWQMIGNAVLTSSFARYLLFFWFFGFLVFCFEE